MATLTELDQHLRAKKMARVYLLLGTETELIRTATARIRSELALQLGGDIAPTRGDASEQSAAALVGEAQSATLFAAHQLFLIRRVESWKAEDLGVLADYVTSPNPDATLILIAEKIDQRTKAAKTLSQAAFTVKCLPLYPREIPAWIRITCQQQNKTISEEAAQVLAEIVGNELGLLTQAIEKLVLYVGTLPIIDLPAVEHVILDTAMRDVFAFTRAVGDGKVREAIAMLERLLDSGTAVPQLLALLSRHWRLLMRARSCLDQRITDDRAIAAALKVPPMFVREYAAQARRLSQPMLQRGIQHLWRTELRAKRSSIPDRAVMTECVLQLMR